MLGRCDECGVEAELRHCPEYEGKWLCENDFELYEKETEKQQQ